MVKLRIAQIAPPWIPVPPPTYGGTELIISWLTEELVKRGHNVTLFASGDSKTSAHLIPYWPQCLWRARLRFPHIAFGMLYDKLLSLQNQFDIIHDHCEFYTSIFANFIKPPILTTLHHCITDESLQFYKKFPNLSFAAISQNQKESAHGIKSIQTIYHGLPFEKYEFNPDPQKYLVWLSRIAPEKGLDLAIEIAKTAHQNLIISGNIQAAHYDYFKFRIKPFIDGKQIQFVGAADFQKKIELLKNTQALIFPIKWPEPFGLIVLEALACGTPVIAFNKGSMPEIIKNGQNGFLVNSKQGACCAVENINYISRYACRQSVQNHFSLQKMVSAYENLYYRVIAKKQNSASQITPRPDRPLMVFHPSPKIWRH